METLTQATVGFWLTVAGVAITSASVVLAIYFYRKTRRVKRLCYVTRSITFFDGLKDRVPGLDVLHKGHSVARVTITRILFWNSGNIALLSADIPESDTLKIAYTDSSYVLDHSLPFCSRVGNSPRVRMNGDAVVGTLHDVSFDYLNKGDGFVIQVAHTGTAETLKISGGIIGGTLVEKAPRSTLFLMSVVAGLALALVAGASGLSSVFLMSDNGGSTVLGLTAIFLGVAAGYFFANVKEYSKTKPNPLLEALNSDD